MPFTQKLWVTRLKITAQIALHGLQQEPGFNLIRLLTVLWQADKATTVLIQIFVQCVTHVPKLVPCGGHHF